MVVIGVVGVLALYLSLLCMILVGGDTLYLSLLLMILEMVQKCSFG